MHLKTLAKLFLLAIVSLPVLFSPKLSAATILNKRVYLLIFNPSGPETNNQLLTEYIGWNDPDSLTAQAIDKIDEMTDGQVGFRVVERNVVNGIPEKNDGFQYTLASYLNCTSDHATCHGADIANYKKILTTYQICEKFNAGEFDELWMFGGPWFGFYESNLAGNNAFWYNSSPTTGTLCTKLLPIMGFSYEPGLPNMIEDFGHRTESTMSRVYGYWSRYATRNNWEFFSLASTFSPLADDAAGCGHVHYAPGSTSDYDWGNTRTVPTFCDEFLTYANGTTAANTRPISCTEFGCNSLGFFTWWYQHMPHESGVNADGRMNNWYLYVFDPNQVIATVPVAYTSPTVASINATSATISGAITSGGLTAIGERGIAYSATNHQPTSQDQKVTTTNATGAFSLSITGLTPNTTYYARAYAKNAQGPAYGETVTFTTTQALLATVETNATPTSITTNSADVAGNVTVNGDPTVTQRGFVYSFTNNTPSLTDSKIIVSGTTGVYTASLTELKPRKTYYVRAYATNVVGTAYGNTVAFTTLLPESLNRLYFTFGKLLYGKYASPVKLRSGDMLYLKNYDARTTELLAISLYDYTLQRNQGYTRTWRNSTAMYVRTNYFLPYKRKYAFIFTFRDIESGTIVKKYFVINTISPTTVTY